MAELARLTNLFEIACRASLDHDYYRCICEFKLLSGRRQFVEYLKDKMRCKLGERIRVARQKDLAKRQGLSTSLRRLLTP